jgi:hypothetical protein
LALPALEALHKAWNSRSQKPKYEDFWNALDAATAKISEYYEKTADSDAFIFAMGKVFLSALFLYSFDNLPS